MNSFLAQLNRILKDLRFLRRWRRFVLFWASVCVFVTTYNLILPAISVEKDNADNVSGLYLEDAEEIDEDQYTQANPTSDDIVTDAPIVHIQEPPNRVHEKSTDINELSASGDSYEIFVTYDDKAEIPDGAQLVVQEIKKDPEASNSGQVTQYDEYIDSTSDTLGCDAGLISYARVFDICIVKDGEKIDPKGTAVDVRCELSDAIEENELSVVNFTDGADAGSVVENSVEGQTVEFAAEESAVYVIVGTTIEKTVLANDGLNYRITVSYGPETGIPENADLSAEEITKDSYAYAAFAADAENALGMEAGSAGYIRLFDIKIVDKDEPEVKYQPRKDTTVDVKIELADKDAGEMAASNTQVVHFPDGNKNFDVVEALDVEGNTVTFKADGFSAYAIVEGPIPEAMGWSKVTSLDEFRQHAGTGMVIGHPNGFFFKDTTYIVPKTTNRKGIVKTKPASKNAPPRDAVTYYFEAVEGQNDQFYVYCIKEGGRQYIKRTTNSLDLTTNEAEKTVFTFSQNQDGTWAVTSGEYYWNMQGDDNGNGFAAYNQNNNGSRMEFWYYDSPETDPYELDNQTYGFMNWGGGVSGRAIMASSGKENTLDAKALSVMTEKDNDEDKLFVPADSEISKWTFHWIGDDRYYLTTVADGSTQYLKIDGNGLHLVESEQEASQIQVVPGTGTHTGEICLKSGTNILTYSGNAENGFGINGSAGNEWLYLVQDSELTSDYFIVHSAQKVSVSDVPNGEKIIVYTRIWNDTTERYEFYAVDSDGTLVRVYESGDSIQWAGPQLNTLLWDFTEYYWEGTTEPNYYYELYNEYSEKCIGPQMTGGQTLQDSPIGIHLNGRRNRQYYSSILTWDDDKYAYAGLKVENGQIVSCPRSEAMDFYFAVMEDIPVDDTLHTVPTVDNSQFGITMRMVNFTSNADQNILLSGKENGEGTMLGTSQKAVKNLLSTNLDENGYPSATKTGSSMQSLYAQAVDVNHLFIQSTYNASGYFEFDSSQNFASLDQTTKDFVVYKELGSYDSGGSRPTLKHGQFFPYNKLEPGIFASVNGKNLFTATAQELPDSDPRKNEQLYLIKNVDAYFGMELEASFTQTLNGKDAWNHDIIYEFTGDDDFWLYVDGELVIDLGGTHSALPGFVNFSTGIVTQRNANGVDETTSLYEIFIKNYKTRGATQEEAEAKAQTLFKQDDAGNWVFPEYTSHTMKIFFMERGAGASNLHMRFNLASVKPGHVHLGKELAGVDNTETVLAEFPYQIYYKTSADGEEHLLTYDPNDNLNIRVCYKETETPVTYKDSITIDGITYPSVFMLKAGEVADIAIPDNAISYRIVECGVNTDVYESAGVKEADCSSVAKDGYAPNRKDYGIEYEETKNRPRVTYVNTVKPEALRTFTVTKKLFDETGENEISAETDLTTFTFRLYLGTEYDDAPVLANMQSYYVKDPNGYYCRWDSAQKKFVPTDSQDLHNIQDMESVTFATSMNGSISKIPTGYTVEIQNLLAGTRYRVEERPSEIPDGYSFQRYEDADHNTIQPSLRNDIPGVSDTIVFDEDPSVTVRNLKGWGLRVNKTWSDEGYMSEREPTYFAVFTRGHGNIEHGHGDGDIHLVEGTVRELPYDASPQTLYWYFDRLADGKGIADYLIREVRLEGTDWHVEEDGTVTGISSHNVHSIHEGGSVTLFGKQKGETAGSEFHYTVHYETGSLESDSNVRVDTVSNTRPGIDLKKMQWDGTTPLEGAVFELKDNEDNLIGTFTSDEEGLITTAFLRENTPYTLTETKTPQGWYGLQTPMTITLNDNTVQISGADASYYQLNSTNTTTLIVKNRPYTFRALKKDSDTDEPMEEVEFALHKQKTVGETTTIDLNPMPGYESLKTDENGVIPKLDNTLPSGTYELREKSTNEGYELLSEHIRFTVSPAGAIVLGSHPEGVTLTGEPDNDGTMEFVMTVLNARQKTTQRIRFMKVDIAKPDDSQLQGARFDLYSITQADGTDGEEIRQTPPLYTGLISGEDGMLKDSSENTAFDLAVGKYHLVETAAPKGFILKDTPVIITVTDSDVTYDEGTSISGDGSGKTFDPAAKTYTLKISNSSGVELPSTGGPGTNLLYLLGLMLTSLAGAGLVMRKRRRDAV